MAAALWQLLPDDDEDRGEHRFPHGRIPPDLSEQAATLVVQWNQLHNHAVRLEAALDNSLSSGSTSQASSSEPASDPDLDLANAQGSGGSR